MAETNLHGLLNKLELTYNGRQKVSNKLEDLSIHVVW